MAKAVLDTNVIVSGLLNPEGHSALILKLASSGAFRCYVSEQILSEYDEVLRRKRLDLDHRQAQRLLGMFRRIAVVVLPRRTLRITADPDDNMFLECALAARADYVVTGNVRHFPARFQDVRAVPPRQFLMILGAELQ